MNPVQAADPASKTVYTFTDTGSLHNAIKLYGYIPLRPDGSPMETVYLEEYDGYVLDGAPINVWIDGVWLEGQKEAMAGYWNSGKVRRPAENVQTAAVEPMPPEVAAQTAEYQRQAGQGGIFGMDTGTLVAVGAGVLALLFIARR